MRRELEFKRAIQPGDEVVFLGVRFTLLEEEFPGVWLAEETQDPDARLRLLNAADWTAVQRES